MGRSTRAEAERHREEVVGAAARLFRERGVKGVSVPDLMAEAGMTHGGFYRQFESKEALVGEATAYAFKDMKSLLEKFDAEKGGDHSAAQQEFARFYLSTVNRDDLAEGCPAAGLGTDVSREKKDSAARSEYADGITAFASWVAEGEEPDFARISTMVGALVLARATSESTLSERILAEALAALGE